VGSGGENGESAKQAVKAIRTFAKFFQELGTAMKHGTLEAAYAWDLFGSAVHHYMRGLRAFIDETRDQRGGCQSSTSSTLRARRGRGPRTLL